MRDDAKQTKKGLCSSFGTGLLLLAIVYPFSLAYQLIQVKPFQGEGNLVYWLSFLIPGGLLGIGCAAIGILAFSTRGNERIKRILTLTASIVSLVLALGSVPQWFAFRHAEFAISVGVISLCVTMISLLYRYDDNEVSK